MPEATRLSVRRPATAGRKAPPTGILIGLGALGDRWFQGWGRSSERQRRKRYGRGKRFARRQAPQRAAHLLVRPQRLVQGRAGPSGQPPGPPARSQPHLHGHLARAPLARRRESARADPAHPLRAVLRALRRRRLRRGPGPAHLPSDPLRHRRRPALDGPADRGPAQRVLAQRPDAGAARLPRELAGPLRGPVPHRAHAALARPLAPGHRRRTRGRAGLTRARAPVQAGAGTAGVHRGDVPPLGRPVRRRPAPQGGRRPAPRGDRPAPGAPGRGHPRQAVQGRRRAGRAGRLDVVRRGAPAHRAEVLRPRPARRQGSR